MCATPNAHHTHHAQLQITHFRNAFVRQLTAETRQRLVDFAPQALANAPIARRFENRISRHRGGRIEARHVEQKDLRGALFDGHGFGVIVGDAVHAPIGLVRIDATAVANLHENLDEILAHNVLAFALIDLECDDAHDVRFDHGRNGWQPDELQETVRNMFMFACDDFL